MGISSIFDINEATQAEARVIKLLSQRSGLSAAEISRLTGLSKSTVARVVEQLRQNGLVVETVRHGESASKRGRPGTILTLNPATGTCVGLLLGPTFIDLTIADVSHAVLLERTIEIEQDYSVEKGLAAVVDLVENAYEETGLARDRLLGVGVAVPGPVDFHTGRVLRSSMVPVWAGTDVRALFASALQTSVFVDNESNCAAIAEMTWGAARGHSEFLYCKLDVGIGGALIVNNQILRGIAGAAGEVGHMIFDPNGPLCRCGNRGCVELYAGWNAVIEPAKGRFGPNVRFHTIAEHAINGDVGCRRLIEDVALVAGRALASVCAVLNPPLIVLGGRQLQAEDILLAPLRESFARHALIKPYEIDTPSMTQIVPGHFRNNRDTALGAVGLVLQNSGQLL